MERIAVVATLPPRHGGASGEADRARTTIRSARQWLEERHMVFLAADTAIFVFEGDDPHAVLGALTGDNGQPVLGAWESLVDGTPKIAREVYSWITPALHA